MKLQTMTDKANSCGERIRKARKRASISQEKLAAYVQLQGLDITQKAISRIELGRRVVPDYEIPFFASTLGVSLCWLLGMEE